MVRDVIRIHKIKFFASLASYNSFWFRHFFLRRNGPTAPTAQRNFWKVTLLSTTRRNKYFVARVAGHCATDWFLLYSTAKKVTSSALGKSRFDCVLKRSSVVCTSWQTIFPGLKLCKKTHRYQIRWYVRTRDQADQVKYWRPFFCFQISSAVFCLKLHSTLKEIEYLWLPSNSWSFKITSKSRIWFIRYKYMPFLGVLNLALCWEKAWVGKSDLAAKTPKSAGNDCGNWSHFQSVIRKSSREQLFTSNSTKVWRSGNTSPWSSGMRSHCIFCGFNK